MEIQKTNAEVVLYQPDESVKLEVRIEEETVWLTTQQMSVLFNREDSNIRRHIINIFKDGELSQENNVHFLHVNGVKKPIPFYNLDVIISVGYRVHSYQGISFRQWATSVLRQYLWVWVIGDRSIDPSIVIPSADEITADGIVA